MLIAIYLTMAVVAAITCIVLVLTHKDVFFQKHEK